MKFRKLRLVALAMSVAVAASAMPSAAFAEDFTSDDSAQFVSDFESDAAAPEIAEPEIPEETVVEVPEEVIAEVPEETVVADVQEPEIDIQDAAEVSDTSDAYVVIEYPFEKDDKYADYPITFYYNDPVEPDYTVTYYKRSTKTGEVEKDPDGNPVVYRTIAKDLYKTQPLDDCVTPGYLWMTVEIEGKQYDSGVTTKPETAFIWAPAWNHRGTKVEIRRDYIDYDGDGKVDFPTCTKGGWANVHYLCTRCGLEFDELVYVDPLNHIMGEPVVTYNPAEGPNGEPVNVKINAAGEPELIDITKDGYYTITRTKYCERILFDKTHCTYSEDVSTLEDKELHLILALKGEIAFVTGMRGIANPSKINDKYFFNYLLDTKPGTQIELKKEELDKYYANPGEPISVDGQDVLAFIGFLDPYKIELANCLKEGYYQVTFYNREGKPVSHEWYPVVPHHMTTEPVVEFYTIDDKNQCVVNRTGYGTYSVLNTNCSRDIEYYIVTHCEATGCPLDHCKTHKVTKNDYEPEKYVGQYEKYTCEKRNETEVERVAHIAERSQNHVINQDVLDAIDAMAKPVDPAVIDKLIADARVLDGGHQFIRKEVLADQWCETEGKIKLTFICKICGEEIVVRELNTKPLKHIWGEPRLMDGTEVTEPTCLEQGCYDAAVYCERCGVVKPNTQRRVIIGRLAHENELGVYHDWDKTDGFAGRDISLGQDLDNINDVLPIKFEFFGDFVIDFNGQLKVGDVASVINAAKGDELAKYTVPAVANVGLPSERATLDLNYIGTRAGSQTGQSYAQDYILYAWAYTECDLVHPEHHKVVLNNVPEITVVDITPAKAGQACEPGTITVVASVVHDGVTYRSEPYSAPYYTSINEYQSGGIRGHVAGDKEYVNEVPATATEQGYREWVVKCENCGAVLDSGKEYFDHEHTADEGTKENIVEATCETDGSYDLVTKCTVCGEVISTEHVVVEAEGHAWGEFEETAREEATALKDGSVTYTRTCAACGATEEKTEVIPATGDYTAPAKVTNIKTTANEGKQKIRVEYAAVKDAEKYRIYWKAHGEASYQKKDTANLSYTISNLTPNTLYDIRVRAAKKVDGTWVWGKTSGVYRRWLKTVATSYTKTSDSITVNITPVEGAVKYQIHISEYKDMTDETVKSVKSTTTAYTIKGLDPATKYFIRVRPITTADGKNYTGALNSVKGVTTKK